MITTYREEGIEIKLSIDRDRVRVGDRGTIT